MNKISRDIRQKNTYLIFQQNLAVFWVYHVLNHVFRRRFERYFPDDDGRSIPRNVDKNTMMIQDMINSENGMNTTESTNTSIFKNLAA